MKKCPKCGKTYDDSLGVCLGCEIPLSGSPDNTVDLDEMQDFARRFLKQFGVTDNFEYIALNVKSIYDILTQQYSSFFENEKHLLITCGAIDIIVYLQGGVLKIEDLERAYFCAKMGECMLSCVPMKHEEDATAMVSGSNNMLLNFVLQLECLIFDVDSPEVGYKEIMEAVISKKDQIKEVLENYNPKNHKKVYSAQEQMVKGFMTSDDFKDIRGGIIKHI